MSKFILTFLLLLKLVNSIPKCLIGENNCTKCNYITKLCSKCSLDIFTPDLDGGCQPSRQCSIGKNYCHECSDNLDTCKKCEVGYFPDMNGGCSYTDNCELSYKGECIQCKNDFVLIGKKSDIKNNLLLCKSLSSDDLKNCEEINLNNGICTKCKDNFYLNEGDFHCLDIDNCYESTFGICTRCIFGYYFNKKENKCMKQEGVFSRCKQTIDGQTCDICNDNFFVSEDGKCAQSNFCSKVGDSNLCLECIPGFYKSEYNSYCASTEHCYLPDTEIGLCRSCSKDYYLDYKDGKCKSNQEDNDLKYCRTADEVCFDCQYPYFLGEDSKCSATRNCASSENGICNLCSEDYYLGLDNKCSNVENCLYSDDYFFCDQCIDKYYYDSSKEKCILEKEGFINCQKVNYNGDKCSKCREGFYLNQNDNLCYSNKEFGNFYKCKETDITGELCTSCEKDYYFGKKYNRCWKIEGCEMSSDDIKCEECDQNHALDAKNGLCVINNKILDENRKYYYKCIKTNEEGNSCEACMENYILNSNNICEDNIHCVEKNNGACQKCQKKENDTFNYCLNSALGCVETELKNCLKCDDIFNFNKCNECAEGYELNDKNQCNEKKKNNN